MAIPRAAYHSYTPNFSHAAHIDERHPGVFQVATEGFGGSVTTESHMWFAAYKKFGDDFESAAQLYLNQADRIPGSLHPFIDDPWKLCGYTNDEISLGTHYVAVMTTPPLLRENNDFFGLNFLMRTVLRHGMAPDSLIDCANWYSQGTVLHPTAATYRYGWATLLFGTPATSWTAEDMQWLVEFGDRDAFKAAYQALTGITSALTHTSVELPFPVLQAVLVEDIPIEYAKEIATYAS